MHPLTPVGCVICCAPQMLQLQKVLQVKTHMRAILESSRLRLGKEFGADNKVLEHVSVFMWVHVDVV